MLEYKEEIFDDLQAAKESFCMIGGTVYFNYLPDGTIKISGLWATSKLEEAQNSTSTNKRSVKFVCTCESHLVKLAHTLKGKVFCLRCGKWQA